MIERPSPRLRHLVRFALGVMATQVLLIAARVAEFLSGASAVVWVPTSLLIFAFAALGLVVSMRMHQVRLAETAERERAAVERRDLLRLRAPDPGPGQCPVCSLTDLDALAADDRFLGHAGTPWARVVPHGPHRAHSECAAVVPYAPPPRSTSGGTPRLCRCAQCERQRRPARPGRGFTFAEACAKIPLDDGRVLCLVHNQGDPACTVYGPPPIVNNTLRDSVIRAYAHCKFCDGRLPAPSLERAEEMLREHVLTCGARPGGR